MTFDLLDDGDDTPLLANHPQFMEEGEEDEESEEI
jgi:hypothetical protein